MNLIEPMTVFRYILTKEGTSAGAALILLPVGT
jgi:hypothetical protein